MRMIIYVIGSIVCSGLFLLLYRSMVSKKAGYSFCRRYLTVTMALSIIIPMLDVPLYRHVELIDPAPQMMFIGDQYGNAEIQPVGESAPAIQETSDFAATDRHSDESRYSAMPTYIKVWFAVLGIYVIGVLVFISLLVWSIISILKMKRNAVLCRRDDCTIAENSSVTSPFTFMSTIFICGGYGDTEFRQIISHESSHVHRHHSREKLVMSLLRAFAWFNPFVWIAEKCLDEVQEWQADHDALSDGYDIDDYRDTILRQLFGLNPLATSGINSSLTKNRILRMKQDESTGHNFAVAIAGMALTAGLFLCFGCKSKTVYETRDYDRKIWLGYEEDSISKGEMIDYLKEDDRIFITADRFFDDMEGAVRKTYRHVDEYDEFNMIKSGVEAYEDRSRDGFPAVIAVNGYKVAESPSSQELDWVTKDTKIFIGNRKATFREFKSLRPQDYIAVLYYHFKEEKTDDSMSLVYVIIAENIQNQVDTFGDQAIIDIPEANIPDVVSIGGFSYGENISIYQGSGPFGVNAATPDARYAIDGKLISYSEFRNNMMNHLSGVTVFRNDQAKRRFGQDVWEVVEMRTEKVSDMTVIFAVKENSVTPKVNGKECRFEDIRAICEECKARNAKLDPNPLTVVEYYFSIEDFSQLPQQETMDSIVGKWIPTDDPELIMINYNQSFKLQKTF